MSPSNLSKIIFGAMGLPDLGDAASARLIHCALDHGVTSFDTAPLYGAGESERILGRALAGRRDRVQLLTKCGLRWDSDHGQPLFEMFIDGQLRPVRKDSRPQGIRAGLERSLRDLNTDVIDVYQVHQYDDTTPIEDVIGELERARSAGKIRAIGVSNYEVPQLRLARASARPLFSTQSPYSLVQTETAAEVLTTAHADGIAFLAYSPLAQGVLAGKYLDSRHAAKARNWSGLRQINSVIQTTLLPLARERNLTIAQVALAWLLAHPGITAAVAGASSQEQLAENAAAANVRLEPSLVAAITAAFRGCKLRYRETPVQRLRRQAGRLKQAARRRAEAWFG